MTRGAWEPGDQTGRTFLITGATAGLGYFSAEQIAATGAHVIISGRSPNRLAAARASIEGRVPGASVESLLLDVTKLGSLRAAAASLRARGRLDGVMLNAGIVNPPKQRTEVEGHEVVLATNVLGHFALAGELLPVLMKTGVRHQASRLVWLGSISVRAYVGEVSDPELHEDYTFAKAYVQSKHMLQALGFEADRRLRRADLPVTSVIAHPGYSVSGRSPGIVGVNQPTRIRRFLDNLQTPVTQSKVDGARSQVRALLDAAVQGGDVVSPRFGLKGAPRVTTSAKPLRETVASRDPRLGERMWEFCEDTTRVRWRFAR